MVLCLGGFAGTVGRTMFEGLGARDICEFCEFVEICDVGESCPFKDDDIVLVDVGIEIVAGEAAGLDDEDNTEVPAGDPPEFGEIVFEILGGFGGTRAFGFDPEEVVGTVIGADCSGWVGDFTEDKICDFCAKGDCGELCDEVGDN